MGDDRWWRGFDAVVAGAVAPGSRVLDVGCGDGRLTFGCAEHAASVYAFDSDEELIESARANTPRALRDRIRFEVAEAAEVELPGTEFDLALFSWSL